MWMCTKHSDSRITHTLSHCTPSPKKKEWIFYTVPPLDGQLHEPNHRSLESHAFHRILKRFGIIQIRRHHHRHCRRWHFIFRLWSDDIFAEINEPQKVWSFRFFQITDKNIHRIFCALNWFNTISIGKWLQNGIRQTPIPPLKQIHSVFDVNSNEIDIPKMTVIYFLFQRRTLSVSLRANQNMPSFKWLLLENSPDFVAMNRRFETLVQNQSGTQQKRIDSKSL